MKLQQRRSGAHERRDIPHSSSPSIRLWPACANGTFATVPRNWQLLRRYAPMVERRVSGGLPKRRLQRVTEYIRGKPARDLTLLELAALENVSASHFKVLFKQSTGLPVHQYVIRTHVDHALNLIVGTSESLSEIALSCGFADQSHMVLASAVCGM